MRLRHHLSKPRSCCVIARPVTVVGLVLLLAEAAASQQLGLEGVLTGAHRCLQRAEARACERTLDQAEELQRQASSQEFYRCQTLLLGLQADLILQQLGQGRQGSAVADLAEIRRDCTGL